MTHRRFAIDRSTGELAEKTTPKDRIEYRVFTILPPIYAKWGIRQGFEPPPIQRKNKVNMASISILEPNHGSRILIDPETPLSFQTIPLKAKVYPPIEKIVWWIDGEKKTVAYPYEMRFQLKPGIHRIQASFPNAEVKSPLISIHVL